MRKIVCLILSVTICATLVFSLTGCGQKKETITLKLGSVDAEDSIVGMNCSKFAELVDKYTEGRVKVDVYPLGQLGTNVELTEGVQNGEVDLTICMNSMLGSLYDEFSALDTPYLYADRDECSKVCNANSEVMKYLSSKLKEKCGVEVLNSFYCGTRQFTSNYEIKKPADMKGLTFRSLAFEINTGLIDSMGATAMQVDITELNQALSTGMVDGQENPSDVIYARKFFETQKYLIMTGHMSYCQYLVINSNKFRSLSEEDQKLVQKAADEAAEYTNGQAYNREDELLEKLVSSECGMTRIDETNGLELEVFKTQVTDYFNKKYGKRFAKVYDLVEKSK